MKKRLSKIASKEDLLHIDWEVRPSGLLVQRRSSSYASSSPSPMITIKISHNSYYHYLTLPSQSTFGDLKRALAHKTGLEPKEQRLLFKGKEKDDYEFLHMAGLEDNAKVILMEDPASKERKLEEIKRNQLKACEAIAEVRGVVDDLSNKIAAIEVEVANGVNVADKQFAALTELLMVQLLELDAIKADGEARSQRRLEVRRVQSLVDTVDNLKARNCTNLIDKRNNISVSTKWEANWEAFDSGQNGSCGGENALISSTKITQDWESFD